MRGLVDTQAVLMLVLVAALTVAFWREALKIVATLVVAVVLVGVIAVSMTVSDVVHGAQAVTISRSG